MEVNNKINPLDIPEILKSVLSYVGGAGDCNNSKHLLKARLVSRTWNSTAIKLLQPQQKTIFANPNLDSVRRLQLYEVIKYYNQLIPGVQLCLKLDISNEKGLEPKYNDKSIEKILRFLRSTQLHCPITALHISSCMEIGHASFWNLIKHLAPNLTELKSLAVLQQSSSRTTQFIFRRGGEISYFDNADFPRLETIEYWIPPPSRVPAFPNLLITMINKALSSLKSLKLAEQPCINPDIHEKMEGLKNLLRQTGNTLNNLNKLEIIIYPEEEFINLLCSTEFNHLECLVLHEQTSIHVQPQFLQFLDDKCPLLSHLEIVLLGNQEPSILAEFYQVNIERFRLPKIKTLGVISAGATALRVLKNLWAMAAITPSVSHFVTNFHTCICIDHVASNLQPLEDGDLDETRYPNVTSMLIKADHGVPHVFPDNASFSMLAGRIWPNLTQLAIDRVDDETVQAVSSGMLISLLSMHAGATSLELITNLNVDGDEDWCSEIFKPNPDLVLLKQNVQELTLRLPVALKQASHAARGISTYLQRICQTFSNLQVLRIDEALLKNTQGRSFEQILKMRRLKSRFPNLQFKTL